MVERAGPLALGRRGTSSGKARAWTADSGGRSSWQTTKVHAFASQQQQQAEEEIVETLLEIWRKLFDRSSTGGQEVADEHPSSQADPFAPRPLISPTADASLARRVGCCRTRLFKRMTDLMLKLRSL